jgi:LPXTG-motif cell wall-anchored protein
MNDSVRKLIGVAVFGVLGALFAMPMVAAGAQTTGPAAGPCTITNGYPLDVCPDVKGEAVTNSAVDPASATQQAAAGSRSLAFTGSNDTPSYVLVGIAALVLGAVLVIAARRRSQVS